MYVLCAVKTTTWHSTATTTARLGSVGDVQVALLWSVRVFPLQATRMLDEWGALGLRGDKLDTIAKNIIRSYHISGDQTQNAVALAVSDQLFCSQLKPVSCYFRASFQGCLLQKNEQLKQRQRRM